MPSKVCDEVTYLFPNFNGCTVEVWEWRSNFIPHFKMYVSVLGLTLILISKMGLRRLNNSIQRYYTGTLYNIGNFISIPLRTDNVTKPKQSKTQTRVFVT